jgi:phenylpyruvate tautomerase PptA (4-oxalocrotonate tautomerase family)
MPTYVVTATKNALSPEAKQALARVITASHCEDSNIPFYLCQVVFHDVEPSQQFLNAELVTVDQIWIRGDVRAGRSEEQKTRIIERIMREGSQVTGVSESKFWVYITDVSRMSEYGRILGPPGQEAEFIASLPADVRARFNIS